MEEARALNYDNLVLSDSSPLTHSADTTNPDYWVERERSDLRSRWDAGALAAEPLVRVAGASPALQHYQNPLLDGATTYEVYRYVTWVDSPQDGTGAMPTHADGNHDGISDANGQDAKRVTVVVVWNDQLGRGDTSLSESSLFSDGQIVYKAPSDQPRSDGVVPDRQRERQDRDLHGQRQRLRRNDRKRLVELRR